jgi:hypothetical protein
MNVAEEIAALRKWLQDDEPRLQGGPIRHNDDAPSASHILRPSGFNQHSKWANQPGWKDWKNFANSR